MYEALEETVEDSYQDLKNNVNHFYDSPEGRYKRTGQLRDSPLVRWASIVTVILRKDKYQ